MSTDVLYPILIGAGCLMLGLVVHLLTRPKPSASDIQLPTDAVAGSEPPNAVDLGAWHRRHEPALLDFFDVHDAAPGQAPDIEGVDEALESAGVDHPAPDMGAELAAMRAAATSAQDAAGRGDAEAATRHRDIYTEYRNVWLERLWQFPVDRSRLETVRRRTLGH